MVYAEITLKNIEDEVNVRTGFIKPEDARSASVTAIVDTGSMNLVITEEIFRELGLTARDEKIAHIANGQRVKCKVTNAVEVHWKNRFAILQTLVIPGAQKVLLGAIALEAMDLMVNPTTQELVGVHGDEIEYMVL